MTEFRRIILMLYRAAGLGLLALFATVMVAAGGARAQAPFQGSTAPDADEPVMFSALEVQYDETLGEVVATGEVEIVQGERVLQADRVTYNQRTGKVTASGNVVLLEPDGAVLFSAYAELTQQMREGVIRNLKMRMSDDSRMTAASAYAAGNRRVLDKGLFTPCPECAEDPAAQPFWQIKADRVIHDTEKQDIIYHNAFLELFGVPVLYTPFFTHPDPTVKRRSGFLAPSFGRSTDVGFLFRIPYYIVISQDFDITVEPIFLTEQGVIAAGEIRKRFSFGEIVAEGSFGVIDRVRNNGAIEKNANRGHVRIQGAVDINDDWRANGRLFKASDDTYMRRHNFSTENVLESRLEVEGFHANSHTSIRAYDFQGLRQDDIQKETPTILPWIRHQYIHRPEDIGGEITVDASLLSLGRSDGPDSRRLSLGGAWSLPTVFGNGQILEATVSLRGDAYYVNAVPRSSDTAAGAPTFTGWTGRILPQASLEWRYPLLRVDGAVTTYVEPKVAFVAAPNGSNPEEIPNEDSRAFELDNTNLFEFNRFAGIDRADGGQRANYGITIGAIGETFSTEAFIGQSYQLRTDSTFDKGAGVDERLSDIVGRFNVSVSDYADVLYRFRFETENLAPKQHAIDFRFGVPAFQVSGNYLFIDRSTSLDRITNQEEITLGVSSQLSENWEANVAVQRDLDQSDTRFVRAGVVYSNDCIRIDTNLTRTFFRDREIRPDDSIFLRVTLKHLGEFGGGL